MRFCAELRRQASSKGFNLMVWKSCRPTVETDEPRDARNLQNFQAVPQRQPHKYVTREKRQLQFHPPVLPAAHAVIQRQKILHGSFEELLGHALFMVRASVGNIPAGLHKLRRQLRSFSIVLFHDARHISLRTSSKSPDTASPRQPQS